MGKKLITPANSLAKVPDLCLIICAHKDKNELEMNLIAFLEQDYAAYKLLLIDNSPDTIIKRKYQHLESLYEHLEIHARPELANKGKKPSLKYALELNTADYILLTDSDCYPKSRGWISKMLTFARLSESDIVLGYSPYKIATHSFLNYWIHYEALITAIQYLSYAIQNLAYMGVGRNILYRSKVFTPELLDHNKDLISGDDDLSVNALSQKARISCCLDPDSFIYSYPEKSWIDYYKQKTRHFSTAHRYRTIHKFMLGLYSMTHFGFYILLVILIFSNMLKVALLCFLLRVLSLYISFLKVNKTLDAQINFPIFLMFDFVHIIFYLLFVLPVFFPKKKAW